jgi:hypothetical protein
MEVKGLLHGSAVLTPEKRASSTNLIGNWVGPIAGVDAVEKKNILLFWESNLAFQSVACRYPCS